MAYFWEKNQVSTNNWRDQRAQHITGPKNENSFIVYLSSFQSKPVWRRPTFFCRTQKKEFWGMLVTKQQRHSRLFHKDKKINASLCVPAAKNVSFFTECFTEGMHIIKFQPCICAKHLNVKSTSRMNSSPTNDVRYFADGNGDEKLKVPCSGPVQRLENIISSLVVKLWF